MLIGAHVSTRGGIDKAIDKAREIGAEVMQTHPSPPQTWRHLQLDAEIIEVFRNKNAAPQLPHYLHAVYLVNLAADTDTLLRQSVGSLVHYMELAELLGAQGVIFHPGSHKGAGFAARLPQLLSAMREVLQRTAGSHVRLIVENSAGAGGCVGCNLEELGAIVTGADSDRVGVCLDTCHAFASGYKLRSDDGVQELLRQFEEHIGFERLVAVHANDSQAELGSNRDRHENIGEGLIGRDGFVRLLADPRLRAVPWILETPGSGDGPDLLGVNLLRELAGEPPVEGVLADEAVSRAGPR